MPSLFNARQALQDEPDYDALTYSLPQGCQGSRGGPCCWSPWVGEQHHTRLATPPGQTTLLNAGAAETSSSCGWHVAESTPRAFTSLFSDPYENTFSMLEIAHRRRQQSCCRSTRAGSSVPQEGRQQARCAVAIDRSCRLPEHKHQACSPLIPDRQPLSDDASNRHPRVHVR